MVLKFFGKNSTGGGIANNEIKQKLQLAKELRKPIIRNQLLHKDLLEL